MIPVLMLLSWWVLKTRYRLVHYVAVCICLLGVGAMVGADLLAGRDQGSSKNGKEGQRVERRDHSSSWKDFKGTYLFCLQLQTSCWATAWS